VSSGLAKDDGPIGVALRESFSNQNFSIISSALNQLSDDDNNSVNTYPGNYAYNASFREGPRGSVNNLEMTSNMGTTAWCAPELLTASTKTNYSVRYHHFKIFTVLLQFYGDPFFNWRMK
jgi:hypothetical protein